MNGAFLWGRVILPDSSLPSGLALIQLGWVVELGSPREAPHCFQGVTDSEKVRSRRTAAWRRSHSGGAEPRHSRPSSLAVFSLPCCRSETVPAKVGGRGCRGVDLVIELSFGRTKQEHRFYTTGEMGDLSQGKVPCSLPLGTDHTSFLLPIPRKQNCGRIPG